MSDARTACSSLRRSRTSGSDNLVQCKKEPLPVPPEARKTLQTITELLGMLDSMLDRSTARSCLDEEFLRPWHEILRLVDRYQREIAAASQMKISCGTGCAACCSHWVEDVNSFEAELIAAHIRNTVPEQIPRIVEQCRRDEARLQQLNALMETKLAGARNSGETDLVDPIDLLLASFYQLRINCPLLDNRECGVYPVRPLTCRMYVSFSDPVRCDPDAINAGDTPTYLFDLGKEANAFIDRLHVRFMKHERCTGLRSLLVKYLL